MFFFNLTSFELTVLLFGVVLGATGVGIFLGRRVRHLADSLGEPFGVLQGALLGVVGLILAFGLSLAVTRYENRRETVVNEANAIGTTYLRAQTLAEPMRSRSLPLLVDYTRSAIQVADHKPGGSEEMAAAATEREIHRRLWTQAGLALDRAPEATAPRLYAETLNEMIDAQATRIAALNNRIPSAVLILELLGAALALGLLSTYLAIVGRGVTAVLLASVLVAFLLLVTCDLDRPARGMIKVPSTPLTDRLEEMEQPPAAAPPTRR